MSVQKISVSSFPLASIRYFVQVQYLHTTKVALHAQILEVRSCIIIITQRKQNYISLNNQTSDHFDIEYEYTIQMKPYNFPTKTDNRPSPDSQTCSISEPNYFGGYFEL